MQVSPCLRCVRVADPVACEDKDCALWRRWYIKKWEDMRFSVRGGMERVKCAPAGVCIGGVHYSQPHRVRGYLQKDPCDGCLCPKDLCVLPCVIKRNWLAARENTLLSCAGK